MKRGPIATSFVLGLALAGCAGLPNPLATPVRPDALHPDRRVPVAPANPAVPPVTPDPVKVDALGLHRAQWESRRIADYTLHLLYGCRCALGGGVPLDVTVRGGLVTAASFGGEPLDLDRLAGFPVTVEDLFSYGERNQAAGKAEFAFDERYGFPTAIGVDPDLAARDDEVRVAVTGFEPAP